MSHNLKCLSSGRGSCWSSSHIRMQKLVVKEPAPACPPVYFSHWSMVRHHAINSPQFKGIMCLVDPPPVAEDKMITSPFPWEGEVDLAGQGQLSWVGEWWRVSLGWKQAYPVGGGAPSAAMGICIDPPASAALSSAGSNPPGLSPLSSRTEHPHWPGSCHSSGCSHCSRVMCPPWPASPPALPVGACRSQHLVPASAYLSTASISAFSWRWLLREASLWPQYSVSVASKKLQYSTILGFRASLHSPFRILILNISSSKVLVPWNSTIPFAVSSQHLLQKVTITFSGFFLLMIAVSAAHWTRERLKQWFSASAWALKSPGGGSGVGRSVLLKTSQVIVVSNENWK